MTLIISAISWDGAVQCSDRLVSDRGQEFDVQSNKTVLYFAPDAVAAIAFTGSAFIDGIHTDTWIVEQLIEHRFSRVEPLGIMWGGAGIVPRIGQASIRLGRAIENAFATGLVPRGAVDQPFEIVLCGWTWKPAPRKATPTRPFVWILRRDATTNRVEFKRSQRYLRLAPLPPPGVHRGSQLITHTAPRSLRNVLGHGSIWNRLIATETAESFEAALVACVRDAAAIHPEYIGRHCMLVSMPPPGYRTVKVTYHPDPETTALREDGAPRKAYSPWVVDRVVMFPPIEQTTGAASIISVSDWTVEQTFMGAGKTREGGMEPQERRRL